MKTVSNTSSLMELAESRSNITTSSSSEENTSGSGGITVVNSTKQTGQSTYALDTTLADCIAMLEAGTQFVVHISTSTYNFYFHPAAYMKNNPSSIDFIGYMNNYIQRATYDLTGFTYGTGGCVVYVTQSDVH